MAAPQPKDIHFPDVPHIPIVTNPVLNPLAPWNLYQDGKNLLGGGKQIKQTVTTVENIGKFFTDPVRIGEAFVGIIMIAVGLNAALKGTPVGNAINTAKTAAKVAAL